ncbi:UDP-N-acetylmuramoyl-L-alanine--D-glutamate ligase [Lacibacterium aquatile]|uniref:UDP-N-acetylmuramoylalanine--D-glutamate ligase n=1 Tax=Lacibacterium aquatile TaxID=1168082 RepID=A0ABW5DUU1_9PROT
MIQPARFHNQTVAVLGLGKSGMAAAAALVTAGARVRAWDDNEASRNAALDRNIPIVDLGQFDWSQAAALVLAPGIPHTFPKPHPVALAARQAGVPIIGDIELLITADPLAHLIAITGTNGKSTTTALIAHILRMAGRGLEVGGNLGQPVMGFVPQGAKGTYVLELSSYQLELCPSLHANTALLLNITPDHLDRHGGMDGYIAAKKHIFAGLEPGNVAVVGIDDQACADMAEHIARRPNAPKVIRISTERAVSGGVYADATHLVDDIEGQAVRVLELADAITLPGRHNAQNMAAAYAVARTEGIPAAQVVAAIKSFPGLAHRQERIAEVRGVAYINDSKATNADATERALVCYQNIHWILGGVAKAGGIASLTKYFDRVRHAYLIGQATESFVAVLNANGVGVTRAGDMTAAVAAAAVAAKPGDTVLLSPSCASFDQYANFEARGDHFRNLVEGLAGRAGLSSQGGIGA